MTFTFRGATLRRARALALCFGAIHVITAPLTGAQDFPARPVRVIVPFAAGGASDVTARIVAPKLSELLGQSVVVENRAGANGIVGTEAVAKSAADGYTVLMATNGTHSVNPSLYPKLPYDSTRDFAAVTEVVSLTNILVVHPSLPVKNVKELIALARSKPGDLTFGSGGNGGTPHLSGELFKSMAKVDLTHVPYKGGGLSTTALLAGEVTMTFNTMLTSINMVKSGRLRPLGVTGARRSPLMPELPTIAEAGVPGYESSTWYGLVAPAATPKDAIAKLHTSTVKALAASEVRNTLVSQGADPVGNTPAEFAAIIRTDIAKWAKVIKASGARPD